MADVCFAKCFEVFRIFRSGVPALSWSNKQEVFGSPPSLPSVARMDVHAITPDACDHRLTLQEGAPLGGSITPGFRLGDVVLDVNLVAHTKSVR
jgi:hypothetical protein